jgi:hypothetical protein
MQPWWFAPPLGLSAMLLRGAFRRKGSRRSKKEEEAAREDGGLSFSCERVCTSDMLLKRLGTLAKARSCKLSPAHCSCLLLLPACLIARPATDCAHRRSRRLIRASPCAACQVRALCVVADPA